MKNTILRSIGFLVKALNKAIAGMTEYAQELSLPHATEADLAQRLANITTKDTAHKAEVGKLKTRRNTYEVKKSDAVEFLRVVRELLRPRFGKKYSQQWDAAGFAGSLAIPSDEGKILRTLHSVKAYLATNPISNAGANITPVRAQELYDAIVNASAAVAQQRDVVSQALTSRFEAEKAGERGLRILLSELHKVLTPTDARWLAFGFKKPGARQTPDVPENLTAVLIGETAISMKWSAAPRAEYYRVWRLIQGVDTEPVPVGSPADLDHTIENLPRNSAVEVFVSALNNGGESALSNGVLVDTK